MFSIDIFAFDDIFTLDALASFCIVVTHAHALLYHHHNTIFEKIDSFKSDKKHKSLQFDDKISFVREFYSEKRHSVINRLLIRKKYDVILERIDILEKRLDHKNYYLANILTALSSMLTFFLLERSDIVNSYQYPVLLMFYLLFNQIISVFPLSINTLDTDHLLNEYELMLIKKRLNQHFDAGKDIE